MLTWIVEGMGESETLIAQAEGKLGISFPATYRTMLAQHSGGDCDELETMMMTSELLPMTEFPDYNCLFGWAPEALARVFPIFATLSGDYYALDYSRGGEPGVLFIDHDLSEEDLALRYASFDDLLKNVGRKTS